MTTFVDFTPSITSIFNFQPTLDGTVYTLVVFWNIFGQRYYITLYDLSGNVVLTLPMISSPLDYDINIVKGYFTTSTLIFREASDQFEITP